MTEDGIEAGTRTAVSAAFLIILGNPKSEMLVFSFKKSLNFKFDSDLDLLCRALVALADVATAGGSSPRLCGQSISGVDASVLRVTVVPEYTFHVWSGFRQVSCAIGAVTLGAHGLLEDVLVMTRQLSNRCSESANAADLRSW